MTATLTLLIGLGSLASLFSLSLGRRERVAWLMSLILATGLWVGHTKIAQINFQRVIEWASLEQRVSLLSLLLVIEGCLAIAACHHLTAKAQGEVKRGFSPPVIRGVRLRRWSSAVFSGLAFLPSTCLPMGLVVLQSWLFHRVSGVSFGNLTLMLSAGFVVLIPLLSMGLSWWMPAREARGEMRVLLTLMQIGLAMCLPVLAQDHGYIHNPYQVDAWLTASVVLLIGLFVGLGWAWGQHRRAFRVTTEA